MRRQGIEAVSRDPCGWVWVCGGEMPRGPRPGAKCGAGF